MAFNLSTACRQGWPPGGCLAGRAFLAQAGSLLYLHAASCMPCEPAPSHRPAPSHLGTRLSARARAQLPVAGPGSDPYIVLSCCDSSGRTSVQWNTTQPVWGETFRLFIRCGRRLPAVIGHVYMCHTCQVGVASACWHACTHTRVAHVQTCTRDQHPLPTHNCRDASRDVLRVRAYDKNKLLNDVELGVAMVAVAALRDGKEQQMEVELKGVWVFKRPCDGFGLCGW